jgi:hypothetical protein
MTTPATTHLLNKTSAYWYACGYNDHRTLAQPYVDPHSFAAHWAELCDKGSRPSLQDEFRTYAAKWVLA